MKSEAESLIEYLDNLRRRVSGEPFSGLAEDHAMALKDCPATLPIAYCDELQVPQGSTVGYSIQHGKHFMYLLHPDRDANTYCSFSQMKKAEAK